MQKNIIILFDKLKSINASDFYTIESDFFSTLYSVPNKTSYPFINAFLMVSSWFGTSERSGVWTFYEATNRSDIQNAVDHLKQNGDTELANIMESGIHDYQDPIYLNDLEYPEDWISGTEVIDKWIGEHRDSLFQWLYEFLITNEKRIMECLDNNRT